MTEVKVSIICPSYNYEKFLPAALDSFISQKTDFPYEIIVVDDCSTDNSREILQDYASRHTDLIRLFYNQENKGITRTWIDICKEAKGKYIARCDADDFWIDELKLQKQVNLLENNPHSKWCNTDYNIVDEENKVLHERVFENGPIEYANTYAKMLATKGMTLPSSWLVETELMNEVNQIIDPESVDDGFPMQLEFFQKTELTFLPDVTVAYRLTVNSDSRPEDLDKIEKRLDGLLKTQLDYLDKYPNADILEIARLQAKREVWQETRAFHQADMIYQRDMKISQLEDENKTLQEEVENTKKQLEDLRYETKGLREEINRLVEQHGQLLNQYNSVIHSRRWTIPTKIIKTLRLDKKKD